MDSRFFFVVPLALAGCGFTEVHEVLLRPPGPPAAEGVEVYVAGQNPQRPFYEVGLLQAVGHGSDANGEHITKALALRAARVGCDAVIRVHVDQGYSMANVVGVCVRWAGSVPVAPPSPPLPDAPGPGDETLPPAAPGSESHTL